MQASADAGPFTARLRALLETKKQEVKKAATQTARRLAFQVRDDIRGNMRQVFDAPSPFTINALYVPPQREEGFAEVLWREGAPKGTPAAKYLIPQVRGGTRPQKRSERRLGYIRGAGGQAIYLVPTRFADRDAYGNVSRGQIVKILSVLQALGDVGANRGTRRSRGRRRAEDYFAIWPGSASQLPPAIYRKYGTGPGAYIRPILLFARSAPKYRARFDPQEVAQQTIRTRGAEMWWRSVRRTF